MNLLLLFIVLNVANVVIQTVKSILTIKGNKWVASITNAIAYGLYTVVLVYMVCDLPLWAKVVVVGGANLVGVFIVKLIEEKTSKDKVWKVEVSVPISILAEFITAIPRDFSFNRQRIDASDYSAVNFYCNSKEESHNVRLFLNNYKEKGIKYVVIESKNL